MSEAHTVVTMPALALRGLTIDHVVSDIVYRTTYGVPGVKTAKTSLLRVLMEAGNIGGI